MDVIFAAWSTPAALAAKAASATMVPVFFAGSGDAVGVGFVDSLGKGFFEYLASDSGAAKTFDASMTGSTAWDAQAVTAAYDFSALISEETPRGVASLDCPTS